MTDYITYLRNKVGHDLVFLNFACGAIVSNNKILLQKRSDSHKWGLPGGAINIGESLEEAAKREIFEETGLTVEVMDLLGIYSNATYTSSYSNGDKAQAIVTVFYCQIVSSSGVFDEDETIEYKHFPFNDLPKIHNQQHRDIIDDASLQRKGCFR